MQDLIEDAGISNAGSSIEKSFPESCLAFSSEIPFSIILVWTKIQTRIKEFNFVTEFWKLQHSRTISKVDEGFSKALSAVFYYGL